MNRVSAVMLLSKLTIAVDSVKHLSSRLDTIEADTGTSVIDKISQIKKIKEELNKVGTEIDIIKKEINLLNDYRTN